MISTMPTCLFLIGFSGSGKSTIGPPLARRLKAEFFDTDAMIEEKTGCRIAKLFSRDGEARFRELERQAIKSVLHSKAKRKVIAIGGGAFANRSTRALITNAGVVVYLSCPVCELYRRLRLKSDRPLLNVRPATGETIQQTRLRKIKSLLGERKNSYNLADLRVATSNKTVAACVSEVYKKVRKLNAPA
jgi:shikimate kinase